MTFEQIKKIANSYGTPFYIMDGDQYVANIKAFRDAFKGECKLTLGYSFKTNYVPELCKIAKQEGCYAEVVSEMEYDLAKNLGFNKIILNGPIKKENLLYKALCDNAIINLDSRYELDTILEYRRLHPDLPLEVGLRINVALCDEDGNSSIQCGLRVGRFGFTTKILDEVVPILKAQNIKIISIHGHTSSSNRAVDNYDIIVSQMLNICERYGLKDIKYFDVGGGFFGAPAEGVDISNKPKYKDYADCILKKVKANEWFNNISPILVIEPGVSVTANVFSYISMIFQLKEIAGDNILLTDGTIFDVKPTYHNNNLPYSFFTESGGEDNNMVGNLVGSTCMEKDIILRDISIPSDIKSGDFIKIDGVGAYTIVLTPTFINYLPPIYEILDGEVKVVRRRQRLEDILSLYMY